MMKNVFLFIIITYIGGLFIYILEGILFFFFFPHNSSNPK